VRRLLILLLLAGCRTDPPPAPRAPPPPQIDLPSDLRTCSGTVHKPPVPPRIRTIESVVVYANALEAALMQSEDVRTACARRLNRVIEKVDAANAAAAERTPQ
jgi:hypothetical protein